MRARITIAIVTLVGAALVFSGGVSLLLVRHAVSLSAQATVRRQADTLAQALKDPKLGSLIAPQPVFDLLESLTGLNGAQPLVIDVKTKRIIPTPRPGSLTASIDVATLLSGRPASGVHDHVAYAAVPLLTSPAAKGLPPYTVALVFESRESFSSDSVWYFLVASGASLLVAAAIASLISSRVASRVIAVADAAERIAEGDLSARVRVDEETYPELVRLDRSLNTMAENLERAREAERAFLLSISHDLRTPLTSIRGYAEAIADDAVVDLGAAAAIVVSESGRLERLIGDLLELARLRTRAFSLDASRVDLAALVRTGAEAFRLEFDAAGVALFVEIQPGDYEVHGDAHRIGQIVANLIENALKFATARVTVSLERGPGCARLSVTDDGPGIAGEDLPHVFERLYTSSRSSARSAGTGLGLAIVTELAGAMGARVTVESLPSEAGGTRFVVTFPDDDSSR